MGQLDLCVHHAVLASPVNPKTFTHFTPDVQSAHWCSIFCNQNSVRRPRCLCFLCSLQVAAPAAAAAVAAPPAGVPPEWAASHKQYGVEQGQLGVRTAEFHGLSPFAVFVHPSPALKLQQLWDDGNELVRLQLLDGVRL
jgi:hypothetical protein